MTLANFNSNFNWQYRMLKEAADCCGIISTSVTPCYCYTITAITGTCSVSYIDCSGAPQTVSSGVDPVYICAQEGTVSPACLAPFNSVSITGGTVACTDTSQCQPIVDCYWYGKLHDNSCTGFNPSLALWTLNGVDNFSGWNLLMSSPPYGTVGNAMQYTDTLSGCPPFSYSDYYFWTVVPSNILSLPPLTGNDGNGNPVSVTMLGPICASKCYEGTFSSGLGSFIVYGINTAEFNATDFSFYVDLSDPGASLGFTTELGRYYPSPPLSVTVTVIGPDEYTIRINGLYSTGTVVYVFMDDGVTVGTLNEVPC